MRPRGNAAGETREKEKERKIVKWPRIINLHTEQSPQKGREFSLGRDRKGENGGLRRGRPPPRRRTFFKNFLEYFTTTPLSLVVVVVVLLTSVRWSVRLCPPAGDIVGPGVGDWRRLQIYDDSSSSPATLESSRKLLRRERTSLFACLEIIWRVACCRDRPPATPRLPENRPNETDNLHKEARGRRSVAELSLDDLRRRRSRGWTRESLSVTFRQTSSSTPIIRHDTIFVHISTRRERFNIYIFLVEEQETLVDLFGLESVWKVFCRGEGEECRSRSGEETGNPLIRFLDSLLVESGCRYPRLWPTHEIRHAWPSCFRAPQFRRRTRPVSRENLVSVRRQTSDQSETQFLARRCSLLPVVSSMGTRDGRKAEGRDNLCQLFNGRGKIGKPQKSQEYGRNGNIGEMCW